MPPKNRRKAGDLAWQRWGQTDPYSVAKGGGARKAIRKQNRQERRAMKRAGVGPQGGVRKYNKDMTLMTAEDRAARQEHMRQRRQKRRQKKQGQQQGQPGVTQTAGAPGAVGGVAGAMGAPGTPQMTIGPGGFPQFAPNIGALGGKGGGKG